MTSDETRNAMERLRMVDKEERYTLVNPAPLIFSCPTDDLIKSGHGYVRAVEEAEGILLYDTKIRRYQGFFLGRLAGDQPTRILPCLNGGRYDVASSRPQQVDVTPVESAYNTCTVVGYAKKQ